MRIPSFALCALLLLAAAPADAGDDATPWTGRVVYEQTATGDSDGAKSFRSMAAKRRGRKSLVMPLQSSASSTSS